MTVFLITAGALLAFALLVIAVRWDARRDERHEATGRALRHSAARATRAAPRVHGASRGLPGATVDEEIDAWLAALKKPGEGFLAAPAIVPGRVLPPAPANAPAGEDAPADAPAETARPAGDQGPMPSHPETWTNWHTALIPAGRHAEAKQAALDYQPAIPFVFWLDDTFAEQHGRP